MPALLWIEIGLCAATAVIASAVALTVLGRSPGSRLNQVFSAVLVLQALWAAAALGVRVLLAAGIGMPTLWAELAAVFLSGAGILLSAFAVRYVDAQTRTADLLVGCGLVALAVAAVPTLAGLFLVDVELTSTGMVTYDVRPGGYVASFLVVPFITWAAILLQRHPERTATSRLVASLIVFLAGFIVGGVLRPILLIPVLTVAIAFSVGLIAHAVITTHFLNPVGDLISELERSVEEREVELAASRENLEEVRQALAKRATQLQTAATIAREAAAIRGLDQLLVETVRLVSRGFGFYHASIYLLDESGDYAILRAASSDGGQRMLERGHRLRVGEEGIVGHVTHDGAARVALDVGANAVSFDDSDLPETRSEAAVPLKVGKQIVGALDVQSTVPEAFTDEAVQVLQTLADQVAVAISNARLLQQAEAALESERQAHGEATRAGWQRLLRTDRNLGARHDPRGLLPRETDWGEDMRRAVEEERTVHRPASVEGSDEADALGSLTVPIKVRGEVIGVLKAYKSGDEAESPEWTPEQVTVLESLSQQLGVALESARLHRDTERRAARERLVSEVAAQMRESLELSTVIKTAAQGIRQAMGLPAVTVRLLQDDQMHLTEENSAGGSDEQVGNRNAPVSN